MWAALLALLPFLQDILNWWNGVEAAQSAANTAETGAETAHQDDGAESVADQNSDNAQNAALTQEANALDNPIPVIVQGAPKP